MKTKLSLALTVMLTMVAAAAAQDEVTDAPAAQGQGAPKAMILQGQGEATAQPYVLPGGGGMSVPKMNYTGYVIPGEGMRIVSVQPGGIAARAGLEPGDTIRRINGRLISCKSEYDAAMINAAMNGGHVDLLVRNVRYGWDWTAPKFVNVHIDLFPVYGYGGYGMYGGLTDN
jgi:hypothetical protein